ncbi:MipA/OmpV family protein [Sphingosinicella sp. BN140058]|uniref:MipA/OmpV family protein n=1 Tax=Sphingosinicella sp. BN140058 TaxID=1892855 RepID=UPI00101031B7|nr:MipA/OmpV family protein [Sphingosinicella sp. BN140058]QAY76030.1 MipA/OmpV family protein [Sphingosinicella sp. BN140058]
MTIRRTTAAAAALLLPLLLTSAPAAAQDGASTQDSKPPRRYRVGLGAQLVPSFPGSDDHSVRPLIDFSYTRDDQFEFEAPDEAIGMGLIKSGTFEIGPSVNIEGKRKPSKVGAPVDKVNTTFEAGAFAQFYVAPNFRLRIDGRRGIGGHDGWVGTAGADFVLRDGDRYLFSIGPRVTFSDKTYNQAYFGVNPRESVATGLPLYDPDGGVQAVGGTAGLLFQVSRNWGIYSYAKYDRLIDDAGRSPVVRAYGKRDQLSGGLALTYSWGGAR